MPGRPRTNRRHLESVPTYADASDVQQFAETLSDAFLQCRTLGHPWKPLAARINQGAYEQTLRCPRCRAERDDTYNASGSLISRAMRYPDGYLTKEIGRISGDGRGLMRIASITRTIAKTTREVG
jgi:hypothetical protein